MTCLMGLPLAPSEQPESSAGDTAGGAAEATGAVAKAARATTNAAAAPSFQLRLIGSSSWTGTASSLRLDRHGERDRDARHRSGWRSGEAEVTSWWPDLCVAG